LVRQDAKDIIVSNLLLMNYRYYKSISILCLLLALGGFGCSNDSNTSVKNTKSSSTQTDSKPPVRAAYMPDTNLTPGDTLDVTKDDICVRGYTKKVRNVPIAVKREVYARYGITYHKPGEYEVDHLIPLGLGGSNSIKNLWPEPYYGDWNAHIKDRLEYKLHKMVCTDYIDLKTAQREIATDWIVAYKKYVSERPGHISGSQ
jgi:hypothetical protein